MKKASIAACGLLSLVPPSLNARGVSPYLPLNLDPAIERQIERVLILADKPVLTRPLAAATVLDALPAACRSDPVLCQEVRRYLARYMRGWGITEASLEGATSSGAGKAIPNRYGLTTESDWAASAKGYWQPYDHALLSLGAVAYQDEIIPEGSLLSLGWDRAQLDIGYRARWLSPLTDSSMLSSTHAATMPSVTLSNYTPLTRFGFRYEAFVAGMSRSDKIDFQGSNVSGRPRLAGLHLSVEPAQGWALGVNRLMQFGGGPRPSSLGDLARAFFSPSDYDNTNANLTSDEQFGNQLASITSQLLFPGKVPFSVYFEYAGEDTSAGRNYLLGNSALSAGIHFPRLWRRFDLTIETSEWQNAWWVNSVYGDGLTSEGHIIGHWGGDERLFGNDVGANSQMVRLGWQPRFGGLLELQYRTLDNESYFGTTYERAHEGMVRYTRPLKYFSVGAEVYAGKNVFGDDFSRIGAFIRYDETAGTVASFFDPDPVGTIDETAELFIDAGLNANRVKFERMENVKENSSTEFAPHLGIGVRRAVSDRSDLGARIEVDDIDGHTLVGVRAIDYRYRFRNPLAVTLFVGAARYDQATPAYGIYLGTGVQWRDLLPSWDLGLDLRYASKVARDNLLPEDPPTIGLRNDTFYDIYSVTFSVTKRF